MKVINGDLWGQSGWKIVPTNLSVNRDGLAVCGRGIALQAANMYPNLRKEYGCFLKNSAHKIWNFELTNPLYIAPQIKLIMLPVKFHWQEKASLSLIGRGVENLAQLEADRFSPVYLPLVGCGFGELSEEVVRPILNKFLNDRFTLVLPNKEVRERYEQSFRPGARVDSSKTYE